MGIPIRLLAGNEGQIEIPIDAQTIDMSIDRAITAFPTPNNILKRFAIDTNTPAIKIEINGVLTDDEGYISGNQTNADSGYNPLALIINTASFMPTVASGSASWYSSSDELSVSQVQGDLAVDNNTVPTAVLNSAIKMTKGRDSKFFVSGMTEPFKTPHVPPNRTIPLSVPVRLKFTSSYSTSHSGAMDVETTVKVAGVTKTINNYPDFLGANTQLKKGDRITKSDGTLLGTVASTTLTTVTLDSNPANAISSGDEIYSNMGVYNSSEEFVGFGKSLTEISSSGTAKFELELLDVNAVEIDLNEIVYIRRREGRALANAAIKIIPPYWLENPANNPRGQLLLEDDVMDSHISSHNIGIRLEFDVNNDYTGAPSITQISEYNSTGDNARDADAIITIPIKGIYNATNPAESLAALIKQALELSGTVSEASFSDTDTTQFATLDELLTVSQSGPLVYISQLYRPNRPLKHPHVLSENLRQNYVPEVLFSGGDFSLNTPKSAGDKVQDMLGIISNSSKHDDLIRGIQIPYDSLVTSSGVTGVARNFFLTFGEIEINQKGALANERSASKTMNQLNIGSIDSLGGDKVNDEESTLFGDLVSAIIPDAVEDSLEKIGGFLKQVGKDVMVSLLTDAHGNDGGIRVIPERFHVRYDAGNNYYVFNLILLASDFVIGV